MDDNVLPDEDGALDLNSEEFALIAEADENVISTIMAQQSKYLARTSRLQLTKDIDDPDDDEADTLLESKLGLSESTPDTTPNAVSSLDKPNAKPSTKPSLANSRLSRPTNIPNETPAPFMSMRVNDLQGARADRVARDNWLLIVGRLADPDFCALAKTCRYFRQLLQPYRTERVLALVDRSNLAESTLRVVLEDDVDLLQVMCLRGDVPDVSVAMVHALHHYSIRCICFLQNIRHDIADAFIEILKFDDVDIFKILRQNGTEITDEDIGKIIEYDALSIFSYLMHLIDPRMLLSVELDRSPESMKQMMLHASDYCSYRIMGYLHSLGVGFVSPLDFKPEHSVKSPGLPAPSLTADLPLPASASDYRANRLTHQYAVFSGDIRILSAIARNEEKIVGALRLYHQPNSGLPRLNEKQLQRILVTTGFKTFKALLDLGYTDIVRHLDRVTQNYFLKDMAGNVTEHSETLIPIPDPERELYIAETLGLIVSPILMTSCIMNPELFERLHKLGMRADPHELIQEIIHPTMSYSEMNAGGMSRFNRTYTEGKLNRLKLAHRLGYKDTAVPVNIVHQDMCLIYELLKNGYAISDTTISTAEGWENLDLETHELESLYQNGFRWQHDNIKRCLDKDRVNIIAATVNLGIWLGRTNIILWVIASRAQACFEYLVQKETLPYAEQAFRYVKVNGEMKRTDKLSDDFPIDWICLAYYMPWPWFVNWIRARASPNLLDKIDKNAREWTKTQGLDRLIPPGWHDIRNFIAKRLITDGRVKITRDLLAGKDVSLTIFED